MKVLYIIRHAKSSWKDSSWEDQERPLSKRGKHDGTYMAKLLHKMDISCDILFHTGAKRSYDTVKAFSISKVVQEEKNLYEASEEQLHTFLHASDDTYTSMGIVGHNPGLSSFVSTLLGYDIELKTGELVALSFPENSWKEITGGRLCLFVSPHTQYL